MHPPVHYREDGLLDVRGLDQAGDPALKAAISASAALWAPGELAILLHPRFALWLCHSRAYDRMMHGRTHHSPLPGREGLPRASRELAPSQGGREQPAPR